MKKVVVIGGGFAGSLIAKELEQEFDVTLIDSKSYFEFTPGILRTIVEPQHASKIQVQHAHYLKRASIVVGDVTDATPSHVLVGKRKLPFDYLALCSGSSYNAPIKEQHVILATRASHLLEAWHQLSAAESALIIGGGLVGVELAAEILTHYSKKELTMVHQGATLIERNHPLSQRIAARFLQKRGARIIFNERVEDAHAHTFVTSTGRRLEADIAFLCTGIIQNYAFLKRHLASLLTPQNTIRVNPTLQLAGYPKMFAAGDIAGIDIEKTAQNAEHQARIVVNNIRALERNDALLAYDAHRTPMVISLGKYNGIFEYGNFVISGIIPALMKAAIEKREMLKKRRL